MSAPSPSNASISTTKHHSPTTSTKPNRLPLPALFVGPPSRNASQLSVARQVTEGKHPLSRQRSALGRTVDPDAAPDKPSAGGDGSASKDIDGPSNAQLRKASERSLDARWREMQLTLDEVELTAQSSTHVFGESHAAALDELRKAQVELARAWGRGNEEREADGTSSNLGGLATMDGDKDVGRGAALAADRVQRTGVGQQQRQRKRGDTDASASTSLSDESARSGSDATVKSAEGSRLEDETAEDIRIAGERRAANEAYFKKVDESVKEVVAKLEIVAEAMKGVEAESRSLWSSASESMSSESDRRRSTASGGRG